MTILWTSTIEGRAFTSCTNPAPRTLILQLPRVVQCVYIYFLLDALGTGQTAGIEFVSISGGTSKHDIGELKDVSSQFLVRFDDQNPKTHTAKELTIKNTT